MQAGLRGHHRGQLHGALLQRQLQAGALPGQLQRPQRAAGRYAFIRFWGLGEGGGQLMEMKEEKGKG